MRSRARVALDPVEEARRHPAALLAAAGGVALLLGAGGTYLGYRASRKKTADARLRAWVSAMARAAQPPPPRHSFALSLVERGATAALATFIATVGKRWLEPRTKRRSSGRFPLSSVRVPA